MQVARRAKLILEPMESYHPAGTLPSDWVGPEQLEEGEVVVGVYSNKMPDPDVLITSSALYLGRGRAWEPVPFRELQCTRGPETKTDVRGISCVTSDGRSIWIPITGSKEGKFHDAFEFTRFLMRVIGDVKKDRHAR